MAMDWMFGAACVWCAGQSPAPPSPPQPVPSAAATARAAGKAEGLRAALEQGVYELGLHLALGDAAEVNEHQRTVWSNISRARRDLTPPRVANAARDAASAGKAALPARLASLESELAALPDAEAAAAARQRVANARAAAERNDPRAVAEECQGALDEIAGRTMGLPLARWVGALRDAKKALGGAPNAASMAKALEILKKQPEAAGMRQRAFADALGRADDWLAAAIDLYGEYDYASGNVALQRCRVPLLLASKAADNAATARRLDALWRGFAEADRMIVREVNTPWHSENRIEGLRLLRQARDEIHHMLEQRERASSGASSSGS